MRNKIRTGDYVMTLHGEEEIDAEDLSVFDVERCILTGKIIERQKDKKTGEIKYRILGFMISGDLIPLQVKSVQKKQRFFREVAFRPVFIRVLCNFCKSPTF
jgi:hypothetical protein